MTAAAFPLTDEDRAPWLDRIGHLLADVAAHPDGAIVACSALRRVYRDHLRAIAGACLRFLFLKGDKAMMRARVAGRKGHYMPASLIDSQFATLETPEGEGDVVTLAADADLSQGMADAVIDAPVAWAWRSVRDSAASVRCRSSRRRRGRRTGLRFHRNRLWRPDPRSGYDVREAYFPERAMIGDGRETEQPFLYDAFISYRHVERDRLWAQWLIEALERYRVPKTLQQQGPGRRGCARYSATRTRSPLPPISTTRSRKR